MCKPVCRLCSETLGCSEYKPQPPRAGRGRWRLHSEHISYGRDTGAHAGAAFSPFRITSGVKLSEWRPQCASHVARVAQTNVLRRTTTQAPCRRAGAKPRQLHENKNHLRESASGRSPANLRRTSRGAPARSSRNVRGRSPARAPPLRERVGAKPQRGSEKKQRKRGPEKYTRTCWAGRHPRRLDKYLRSRSGSGRSPTGVPLVF